MRNFNAYPLQQTSAVNLYKHRRNTLISIKSAAVADFWVKKFWPQLAVCFFPPEGASSRQAFFQLYSLTVLRRTNNIFSSQTVLKSEVTNRIPAGLF